MASASKISLILGGARSGKSSFAEKLAHRRAGEDDVLYVATLQPFDKEMRDRITAHQASRLASWHTVEAPFSLAESLLAALNTEKLALIDCLTVWTSNLTVRESGIPIWQGEVAEEDISQQSALSEPAQEDNKAQPDYKRVETEIMAELEGLVKEARQRGVGLIMVSNEVGMGLVPPYPLGRAYRDLLGRVNQRLAALSDEVFLVVAGIPVDLKKLEAALDEE